MKETSFVIRVYGIYIHPVSGLLVSDEIICGKKITKFPGGGLEYGEGTIECLRRELMEETFNEFKIINHFYTTDYFVESAFHKNKQVLSIYYLVEPLKEIKLKITETPFDLDSQEDGSQTFRYVPIEKLSEDTFTLTIDRTVASLLKNSYL